MNNATTEWTQLFTFAFGLICFLVTSGWISAWWFSKKFNEVHDNIDNKTKELERNIVKKLEYHERHDDVRFADIKNDVWDIRVRNAARDGVSIKGI